MLHGLNNLPPVRTIWPKQQSTWLCVADAFASGDKSGIGGAIVFPSGQCSWFSLPITHNDFKSLNISIHDNLQKDITSLETLAQIALYITIQFFPGSRIPIRIPTLSDNTMAEATSNKLFSTSMLLEKLSLLISSSCIEVDVSHIPGHDNDCADALSRWDGVGQPPIIFFCTTDIRWHCRNYGTWKTVHGCFLPILKSDGSSQLDQWVDFLDCIPISLLDNSTFFKWGI